MGVSIDKELSAIRQIPGHGNDLAVILERLVNGINNLGTNIGADPTQTLAAPPPVQKLNVKASGGVVHATIDDANAIKRSLHYFVEYSTSPTFLQPHVVHLGASRSMPPLNLPALDDDGNPQQFYFRAYSQYPGGDPGVAMHYGGTTPTAVDPGGTMQLSLLPSTGSGTAQASGQQGGSGFGKVLHRPAPSSKRQG